VKGANVIALRPPVGRWRLVAIAICYIAGLILIANLAFGTSMFFGASAGPARTGAYDTRLPIVAPVDPGTIAKAVIEAAGGDPTIGQPLPAAPPNVQSAPPATTGTISPNTTPTYSGVTTASTISYADLLALIPTYLTFPSHANPHRK